MLKEITLSRYNSPVLNLPTNNKGERRENKTGANISVYTVLIIQYGTIFHYTYFNTFFICHQNLQMKNQDFKYVKGAYRFLKFGIESPIMFLDKNS